jgi:hypothetical protein
MAGADFFMDPSVVDEQSAARLRSVLKSAIEALEMRRK